MYLAAEDTNQGGESCLFIETEYMNKILVCLFIMSSFITSAQNNLQKNSIVKVVDVPDSIKNKLVQFLEKVEAFDSSKESIFVNNLIYPNDYHFIDGIYQFRIMATDVQAWVFIYDNHKLQIFKSHYVNSLLKEYSDYIDLSDLSVNEKILYLKGLSIFLENENKVKN